MHKAGQWVRVADAEALATVLKSFVVDMGSRAEAAEALGISQAHLSRLIRHRSHRAITHRLYQRLKRSARGESLPLLERALVKSGAAGILAEYNIWLANQLRPYLDTSMVALNGFPSPLRPTFPPATASEQARDAATWATLDLLYADREAGLDGLLLDFERKIVRAGFGNEQSREYFRDTLGSRQAFAIQHFLYDRGQLAVVRVIEPFLGSARTLGMEVSVQDLRQAGTLRRFVNATIQRELIQLGRPADLQRAQEIDGHLSSKRWVPVRARSARA